LIKKLKWDAKVGEMEENPQDFPPFNVVNLGVRECGSENAQMVGQQRVDSWLL
jgi:hypothetical protein